MKKIFITASTELKSGYYFDLVCSHPEKPSETVRYICFNHEGTEKRVLLSCNRDFYVAHADTSIVPAQLRFPDIFEYAGFVSPYGIANSTAGAVVDLLNRCLGKYHFELPSIQEVYIEDIIEVPAPTDEPFIAANYESELLYTGQHGYHFSHSARINHPMTNSYKYRIGVELEVEATNRRNLERIQDFKSNWFFMERDSSLNDYGVEFVTIPLLPKDARNPEFWGSLCATLGPIAKSWDSSHCGLHIHIGREILGTTPDERSETLGKLLYLYHHHLKETTLNSKIFGRERGYHDIECKSGLARAVDILGPKVLKKETMRKEIDKELKEKSFTERYFDINILNSATIEFRRGKGSLRPVRIAAVVAYCELLCNYAKKSKWDKISYQNFESYLRKNAGGALKEILDEI